MSNAERCTVHTRFPTLTYLIYTSHIIIEKQHSSIHVNLSEDVSCYAQTMDCAFACLTILIKEISIIYKHQKQYFENGSTIITK